MSQPLDPQTIINQLIQVNQESKRNFYTTAAQMENRATKLLLKAYAQERARFGRELQQSNQPSTPAADPVPAAPAGGFFQRGWLELKSALVIQRQRRHRLLLAELQQLETNTVDAYAKAVAALPASLRMLVERQYERVRAVHRWVTLLGQQQEQQVVVRLFNQWEEAEQAIGRLAQMGIPRSELAIVPVDDISVYTNDQKARPRATREAIITGGFLGLLAGGGIGLVYGFFHRIIFPEISGFLASSPTGIMWEIALYGALIGCVFALIFSILIASSAAETDAYLYEESFQQGNTLIAVATSAANRREVERVIGLKHEHEIAPMTA